MHRLRLAPAIPLAIIASVLAMLAIQHRPRSQLLGVPSEWHSLVRAARTIPLTSVLLAGALTCASFLLIGCVEAIAVDDVLRRRAVGQRPAPSRRRALAMGMAASAVAHVLGLSIISGGSVRHRAYTRDGLDAREVAGAVGLCTAALWLGAAALGGMALIATADVAVLRSRASAVDAISLCIGAAAVVLVLLACGAVLRRGYRRAWGRWLPTRRLPIGALLVVLSAADWLAAACVLYVLLPSGALAMGPLVLLFVTAQTVGAVSGIPGGAGVTDVALATGVAARVGSAHAIAALVAFRAIYYGAPLVIVLLVVACRCISRASRSFDRVRPALRIPARDPARVVERRERWLSLAPRAMAGATFVCGVVLLTSGAVPPLPARMQALHALIPNVVISIAYVTGSLTGAALLLAAFGLVRRLRAAVVLTAVLLIVGMTASLLKGVDYEEAIVLAVTLALLARSQRAFSRPATLVAERFTTGWTIAIAAAIGGSLWLATFFDRYGVLAIGVPWHFRTTGSASRAFTCTALAAAVTAATAVLRLLRPVAPPRAAPDDAARASARHVVAQTSSTTAHLALVGDKALLFNEDRSAFLMYGIARRSWVAMGDPVGSPPERAKLARQFGEMALAHGGRPVFYHVAPEMVSLYVELGLTVRKVGESARVALSGFSMEGAKRRWLRKARHAAITTGCCFEVVQSETVPTILRELRRVSDAWLAGKRAREKGFSMGRFDDRYLSDCPIAVVRQHGVIVAFANVWTGDGRTELSVDLMRFHPDAPRSVIDYLFGELMLWAREHGYAWFDLGVAPLAGLDSGNWSGAMWNRVGTFAYRHGTRHYDFAGLRQYKAKFLPEWSPRFVVTTGTFALPGAIADVMRLVTSGNRLVTSA